MKDVTDGLTATYQPEGSAGLGKVQVSASVPPFAGTACGYFNDDNLRAFATDISAYPLADGARPQLSAGLDNQETVGLTVFQVTSRGQLGVHIHLAAIDHDAHSPTSGIASSAHMLLLTSYNALQHFAADLRAAVDQQGGSAQRVRCRVTLRGAGRVSAGVLVRHAARPTRARADSRVPLRR